MIRTDLNLTADCDTDASARRNGDARGKLRAILRDAVQAGASDVHLVAGYPPVFRIEGQLVQQPSAPLDREHLAALLLEFVLSEENEGGWEGRNLDCSLEIEHADRTHRFRVSIYRARGAPCACFRLIPGEIPSFEWLGFPTELADRLISYPNGMVVLTGVTGSGKSSTLAALIAHLRERTNRHVLTIEEPIEYVHPPAPGGLVTQREVGRDVGSFAEGLKYALRQDPDVILVGEIRDPETAQMAVSAAETGHLIFTTLHTRDAKGALTRLIDLFPRDSQEDLRKQLAMALRSVVSQHLLPPADPTQKRVLALEVLHVNRAVEAAIRTGKIESLESCIQTGGRDGMLTLDDDLRRLVREGRITGQTARQVAKEPESITGGSSVW